MYAFQVKPMLDGRLRRWKTKDNKALFDIEFFTKNAILLDI